MKVKVSDASFSADEILYEKHRIETEYEIDHIVVLLQVHNQL